MKKAKVLLSAFAILAIVAGALAFKSKALFGLGSVYCTSTCPAATIVNFKVDPAGFVTAPCGAGVQPYVLIGNADCTKTLSGTTFSSTTPGK